VRILGGGKWHLRKSETIALGNRTLLSGKHVLVGITRVRNESLILQDTLDYVGAQVDAIIAYDDASTDDTLEILRNHPKVALVIANTLWESDPVARLSAETRHRGLLLQLARSKLNFDWALCFDADERIIGDLRGFIGSACASSCNGVRVRLFDAYMTADDHAPLLRGQRLLGFRRFFGPEQRDILMLWRNLPTVRYEGFDSREPTGVDQVITHFYCQHYGKALSVQQWEDTCDYYVRHFPAETYGQKWLARKGHAIHAQSDFSRTLIEWGPALFSSSVQMSPVVADTSEIRRDEFLPQLNVAPVKQVLIATHDLIDFAGSEVFTLELAIELREMGWKVVVATLASGDLMRGEFEKRGLRVIDLHSEFSKIGSIIWDLAWVHHGPVFQELFVTKKVKAATVVFCSLSHFEPLEAVPRCGERIDYLLAHSLENRDFILHELGLSDVNQVLVFPNAVPTAYKGYTNQFSRSTLKQLVIVSNHPPPELLDAAAILKREGVDVAHIGLGGTSALISPERLLEYDAVVTIGKTTAYCFALKIPVYCYDHFGGPGWLNESNFALAGRNNFSGRGFEKKDSEQIARELTRGYDQSLAQLNMLAEYAETFLDLRKNLERLFSTTPSALSKQLENNSTDQIQKQHAQYIHLVARLNRHQVSVDECNREIARLANEVLRVKSTFSWRCTAPFRVIFNLILRLFRQ